MSQTDINKAVIKLKEFQKDSETLFENWKDKVAFEFSSSFVTPSVTAIDNYVREVTNLVDKLEEADFVARKQNEQI